MAIIADNDKVTQTCSSKNRYISGNASLGDPYHESRMSDWFGHQGVSGCVVDGRTGGGERGRCAQDRSNFLQVRTPSMAVFIASNYQKTGVKGV